MRLCLGLLLGSAAALGACSAQAADLPMAEPVEYVKICDTYGTGFFYIPGTGTCLRDQRPGARRISFYDEPDRKDKGGTTPMTSPSVLVAA